MRTSMWNEPFVRRARRPIRESIRRAVEGREILLRYQPVVSLKSGAVSGFEAISRWRSSRGGEIPYPEFVAEAKKSGVAFRLEYLALREACRRVRTWREMFPHHRPLTVNVALPDSHLEWPGIYGRVGRALDESGLDGESLRLGFSEGAVMRDVEGSIEAFERLRKLGVAASLDRFGTGYSSLGALHRLPLDALKMDGSFVGTPDGMEVARTVTTLAHHLGMDAVACGVETSEQIAALREMGCDFAQGDRFARPVKSEVVEAILRAEPRW